MSEEPKEPAKKKGKLPIILILALVLGGGGFFMLKSKGGEQKEPQVKLGAIETLPEFLVNLRGDTYLQTEIALQMRDGFKAEELATNMPAVRDVILTILSGKTVAQVSSSEGKAKLKTEIATGVNRILDELTAPPGKKNGKKEPREDEEEDREHPDWESDTGPVLKVYFTKFATQ